MDPVAPSIPPVGEPDLYLPPELIPDLDQLVSEDGKPVDNILVERQYKLLIDPLYTSWAGPGESRPWVALANVGWYHADKQPALVPDVLLSLDIDPRDPRSKEGRSYIQWVVGKQPDLVIEIVSDSRGGEGSYKLNEYARLGVPVYVIYDPEEHLGKGVLRAFELRIKRYKPIDPKWIEDLGLGLMFWEGTYLGIRQTWLRWCDRGGTVLYTGQESAAIAKQERDQAAKERDQAAKDRDQTAKERDKLREQLRALGVDPDA
jgi:Uma2 family endonuclease